MNDIERFKILCNLTLELTKLKHSKCNHLAIENFAPEMLERLLEVFAPPLIEGRPEHTEK